MPRPKDKTTLLKQADEQFNKMWQIIDSMSDKEKFGSFNLEGKEAHWKRDKNIRDILVHLYEWHQLLLTWVKANQSGDKKPFLPEPYTWKTYGDMNVQFWKKHQNTPYEKAETMLKDSHKKVMSLIDEFTNDELFTKSHFNWTGTTNLGSYMISTTSSHYDWAIKKLKKVLKENKS